MNATWQRKTLMFLGAAALWGLSYAAVGRLLMSRTLTFLPNDPVWRLPFWPAAIVPYVSASLAPLVAAYVVKDLKRFNRLLLTFLGALSTSEIIYLLLPLGIHRPPPGTGFWAPVFAVLQALDPPVNLFPSMHVVFTLLFNAATGREHPRARPWLVLWTIAVAASTLLTRQHYVVDVIGGLALGIIAYRLYLGRIRAA